MREDDEKSFHEICATSLKSQEEEKLYHEFFLIWYLNGEIIQVAFF